MENPLKKSYVFVCTTWTPDISDSGRCLGIFKTKKRAIESVIEHIKEEDMNDEDYPNISERQYDSIREETKKAYKEGECTFQQGSYYKIQRFKFNF